MNSWESETKNSLGNNSIVNLGVAVDSQGNIFLADDFVNLIRKYGGSTSRC